jgi:hypothetical protein
MITANLPILTDADPRLARLDVVDGCRTLGNGHGAPA